MNHAATNHPRYLTSSENTFQSIFPAIVLMKAGSSRHIVRFTYFHTTQAEKTYIRFTKTMKLGVAYYY